MDYWLEGEKRFFSRGCFIHQKNAEVGFWITGLKSRCLCLKGISFAEPFFLCFMQAESLDIPSITV